MEILEYIHNDGIAQVLLHHPGCRSTTDGFVLGEETSQCSGKCLFEKRSGCGVRVFCLTVPVPGGMERIDDFFTSHSSIDSSG